MPSKAIILVVLYKGICLDFKEGGSNVKPGIRDFFKDTVQESGELYIAVVYDFFLGSPGIFLLFCKPVSFHFSKKITRYWKTRI